MRQRRLSTSRWNALPTRLKMVAAFELTIDKLLLKSENIWSLIDRERNTGAGAPNARIGIARKGRATCKKKRSIVFTMLLREIPAASYSPVPPSGTVPSALRGLTAVFGMGTGVTPSLWRPEKLPSTVADGRNSDSLNK
jgi:hypothetical protein